jgi:hypothetical protein
MKFVESPNLPSGSVCLAAVDSRISDKAADMLEELGIGIVKLRPHPDLYGAVCCHPDMMLHHIGGNIIIYAPGTDPEAVARLAGSGFRMIRGESLLKPEYPHDIAYNVARVGKWYFHNLKHTDRTIKEYLDRLGIEPVHVAQGYAKCSVLPVDGNSVITTDAGIARAAEKKGIDVFLLETGNSIRLPGLDHGFIGGACGMISDILCAVNGRISGIKCFEPMLSFLSQRKKSVTELSSEAITDIGSIIPLMQAD